MTTPISIQPRPGGGYGCTADYGAILHHHSVGRDHGKEERGRKAGWMMGLNR